jgi:hypothetical protein
MRASFSGTFLSDGWASQASLYSALSSSRGIAAISAKISGIDLLMIFIPNLLLSASAS